MPNEYQLIHNFMSFFFLALKGNNIVALPVEMSRPYPSSDQ